MGKHPVDVMLDMAVEEDLKTEFFAAPPNGKIEHLKELMDDPYVLFGVSDGGAHTKFLTAGRYPTETLCKVVREHKMLSLEDVHWRLSALPAEVAGFHGRGVLKKGAPADIVVYDFDGLRVLEGEIAHDLPGGEWRRIQRAQGYKYVLVNGEVTIRNDRPTNTHSGRLLRHGYSNSSPREAWEVARRAGGVMSSTTDAHDPSARFAGTSPSKTMGRRSYLIAVLRSGAGIDVHLGADIERRRDLVERGDLR